MFERFTERARQVVVYAQEAARELQHPYIGTEHILLGLIDEGEGLAGKVLDHVGIKRGDVTAEVVKITGGPAAEWSDEWRSKQIPFTPRGQKVCELALREALSLGHNYIGTEHMLLGLVREGEGVAARILLELDADSEKVRNEVMRLLSGPGAQRTPTPEPEPEEDDDPMVSVTMRRSAALKFHKALIRGSVKAESAGDDDTADWLMWGVGRVSIASPPGETN